MKRTGHTRCNAPRVGSQVRLPRRRWDRPRLRSSPSDTRLSAVRLHKEVKRIFGGGWLGEHSTDHKFEPRSACHEAVAFAFLS